MIRIDRPPLRRVLRLDAALCVASGVLMTLGAAPLASALGLSPALLLGAGAALFPIALLMLHAARREPSSPGLVRLIVAGNMLWVGGSLLLVAVASPTGLGAAVLIAQAAVVAGFAWAEAKGAGASVAA